MKIAALARKVSTGEPSARGGGSRKPFFTPVVQRKAAEDAPLQARLKLGRPGDRLEREADAVADRVVAGDSAGPVAVGLAAGVTPLGQRREEEEPAQARTEEEEEPIQAQAEEEEEPIQAQAGEEEEEPVQAQAEEEEEEPVQAQAEEEEEEAVQAQVEEEEEEAVQTQVEEEEEEIQARATPQLRGAGVPDEVARQVRAARGRGNPLPGSVRAVMEQRFGADFSGVRIHTDSAAVLLSKALRAQAFTRGNDIFFNEGRFSPGSRSGSHLLAHELTHTIQQGAVAAAAGGTVQREPVQDGETYEVRPEIVEAIRLARGEIGKVNAKLHGGDGKRIGWERLREYFNTALGGPVIHESVVDRVVRVQGTNGPKDALPSWCGIFTWWAMKKAGIPLPDWKLGAPALDAMQPRPQGELPRKGDIAIDVVPYNHFAMVTGLESAKDAEGKPTKLTRVATVNGNTAGENNLGGQVQERWDVLSRWDHFLDPVGKMNLPDAPMVTVSRVPDEDDGTAQAPDAGVSATEKETDAGPRPELDGLNKGVAPPGPDAVGGVPEADLSLPPRPPAGPAEEVAEVEQVDLSGSSDQATSAFLGATPSSMAKSQPSFAPTVDGKVKGEQKALADSPPALTLKTSGKADAPLIGRDELPVPGDITLGDGVKGKDPGPLDEVNAPAPEPFTSNAVREREMDREQSGSFWDAFKSFVERFTAGIRTRDPGVSTRVTGDTQVELSGQADAGRMDTQREEGTEKLKAQRDRQTAAFRNHPGQSNIRPRKVDENRAAPVSAEPAAQMAAEPDTAMQDYAQAALPQDVRSVADAKLAKKLQPNLASVQKDTAVAAARRDAENEREIEASRSAAAQLGRDTDDAQRRLVIDNRGKVAQLQGEGIGQAYENVNAFARAAAGEQSSARRGIGDHVRTEEGRARDRLQQGEKDARTRKEEGEREAETKKTELKKKQKKKSWWGSFKDAVKSAVKAVTKAIDVVFTAMRKAVKFIIEKARNAAIGLINAARTWVVDKLNKFRDWAKSQVNRYLKDSFPGLAKRINAGIDAVADKAIAGVNKAADLAIAGVNKLADALGKVLDKILAVFQTALKTVVRVAGAVMTGDFAEALRAAIEGACEIAGIDPKPVFAFLDRAGKAIMSILKEPVKFIKNLFGAIGAGIGKFFSNIRQHLIQGVIGWLTGALSEVNLTGPFEFTPKGILKIVLQILGLTYDNIKARVIRRYPKAEKIFSAVEKGFALLKRLVVEGPIALWEEIKASLSNLKGMVMGAIRNWLIVTAIKEGIVWLLSFTNPASAIVKVVKLVFDLVMFLVERAQQIWDFVKSVYEAVAAMAAGNFAKVTAAIERALARSIPVLISLFASILGLGGIAKQVRNIIQKVTRPINKVIDKVVDKIIAFARKLLKKVKAGAKKVKKKAKAAIRKLAEWWKAKSGFKEKSGHQHTLFYKGGKRSAKLHVASTNPTYIPAFLTDRMNNAKAGGVSYTAGQVQAAQIYYRNNVAPAEKRLVAADSGSSTAKKVKDVNANKALADALQKHLDILGRDHLRHLFGPNPKDFPPPRLPVMADNVKARSFAADYIVRGNKYPHAVKTGTESGRHVGNIEGWSALQNAGMTVGSKFVRMHLLPHRLGGDAVDSNLAPASGPKYNTPFSNDVEQPAIRVSTEGSEPNRQPIWYKFNIGYHSGTAPAPAFPSLLEAEWGYYKRDTGKDTWSRDKVIGRKSESPKVPAFTPVAPNINDNHTTAGDIASAAGVDAGFGGLILKLRDELGGSFGTSQANFTRRMNDRYLDRATGATKRGIQDYAARLGKVKSAISGGKVVMK